jgi:hypothetical protein
MPGARLPMRNIRDVLRAHSRGHVEPQDRGEPVDRGLDGHRLPAPRVAGRADMAAPGRDRRRHTGAACLPAKTNDEGATAAAELGGGPTIEHVCSFTEHLATQFKE